MFLNNVGIYDFMMRRDVTEHCISWINDLWALLEKVPPNDPMEYGILAAIEAAEEVLASFNAHTPLES